MEKAVEQIAKEYKAALQELYGDDLAELVLFGTYVRGISMMNRMLISPWYSVIITPGHLRIR